MYNFQTTPRINASWDSNSESNVSENNALFLASKSSAPAVLLSSTPSTSNDNSSASSSSTASSSFNSTSSSASSSTFSRSSSNKSASSIVRFTTNSSLENQGSKISNNTIAKCKTKREKNTCKICKAEIVNVNRHMKQVHNLNSNIRKIYKNKLETCRVRQTCPRCSNKVVHLSEHLKYVHKIINEAERKTILGNVRQQKNSNKSKNLSNVEPDIERELKANLEKADEVRLLFEKYKNTWHRVDPKPLTQNKITINNYQFSSLFLLQYGILSKKSQTIEGEGFFGSRQCGQEILRLCIKIVYQLDINLGEKFDMRAFIVKDLVDKYYFDLLEVRGCTYYKYYGYYRIIINCLKLWSVEPQHDYLVTGIAKDHLDLVLTRIDFTKKHSKKVVAADLRKRHFEKHNNVLDIKMRHDWFDNKKRNNIVEKLIEKYQKVLPYEKFIKYQKVMLTDAIMCSGCRPKHLMCLNSKYLADALQKYVKGGKSLTSVSKYVTVHCFGMHKTSKKYDVIMLRIDTLQALISLFKRSPFDNDGFTNSKGCTISSTQASRIAVETIKLLLNKQAGSQKLRIMFESLAHRKLTTHEEKEVFSTSLQHDRETAVKSYIHTDITDECRSRVANKVFGTMSTKTSNNSTSESSENYAHSPIQNSKLKRKVKKNLVNYSDDSSPILELKKRIKLQGKSKSDIISENGEKLSKVREKVVLSKSNAVKPSQTSSSNLSPNSALPSTSDAALPETSMCNNSSPLNIPLCTHDDIEVPQSMTQISFGSRIGLRKDDFLCILRHCLAYFSGNGKLCLEHLRSCDCPRFISIGMLFSTYQEMGTFIRNMANRIKKETDKQF